MTGIAFAICLAAPAWAGKRVALVIGNANYQTIGQLKNPTNDAPDVAQALRDIGFDVIAKTDLTRIGFGNALSEFSSKANDAEVAVFYYAGHGVQSKGNNYLLSVDISVQSRDQVRYNALNLEDVQASMDAAGVKVVILDACRDDPFAAAKTASRSAGGGYDGDRGLARIERTEGSLIAFAAAAGKTANDGSGRNSPFAAALIKRLPEPNINLDTMFRNVANDVYDATHGAQRPEYTTSLREEYILNNKKIDGAIVAWSQISSSKNILDFLVFRQKFPASPLAVEADNRIAAIAMLMNQGGAAALPMLQADPGTKAVAEQPQAKEVEQADRQQREKERIAAEQADKAIREKEVADAGKHKAAQAVLDRLEAQRVKKEADDAARQATLKEAADRLAMQKATEAERIEMQRVARERADAEKRIAAEKIEAARVAEADRKALEAAARKAETDRIAAAKVEAARVAAQVAETRRQADEAVRKAESERNAADKAEAARVAAQVAEGKRQADEAAAAEQRVAGERVKLAMLEDQDLKKREAEVARQQLEQLCSRETADLKQLSDLRRKDEIEAMRKQSQCPTLSSEIDRTLKELSLLAQRACDADRKVLAGYADNDATPLRALRDAMTCEGARTEAGVKIARLEADAQTEQIACASERDLFAVIDQSGMDAPQHLAKLSGAVKCTALRPAIDAALSGIQMRARAVQTALTHAGCYAGPANGQYDKATRASIGTFVIARGAPAGDIRITDDFMTDLTGAEGRVCPEPPANAVPPVAETPDTPAHVRPVAKVPSPRAPVAADVEPARPMRKKFARPGPELAPARPRPPVRVAAPRPPAVERPRPAPPAPVAQAAAPAAKPAVKVQSFGVGF